MMEESSIKLTDRRMRWPLAGFVAGILFFGATVAVLIYFDTHEQILRLLQWFEAQGPWAPLWFILIMAAAVVLVLPGVLLTTGAGFAFGVVEGSVYVVVGTTLGATLAFLIARYLFGQRARQFVMARSRFRLASEELAPQGWKIVLMTRLIPFFPGKISNYFFGLTPFSLRGYIGGSLLGFIPFSIHSVYLGSIAADLSTLGARNAARTPLEWSLYGAGFIGAVAAVVYLSRLARRALARYTEKGVIAEILP